MRPLIAMGPSPKPGTCVRRALKSGCAVLALAALGISVSLHAAASPAGSPDGSPQTNGPQSPPPPGVLTVGAPGLSNPRVLRRVQPKYTAEAMAAKIQGDVTVECVVQTDGTVGEARVAKSLDPVHGLDDEAIRAASQWRFEPGRKDGIAVRVLITIDMTFRLANSQRATPFRAPSLFDSVPSTRDFRANVMSFLEPAPTWPVAERSTTDAYVRVPYPPDWTITDNGSSSDRFVVQSVDGTCLFLVSQLRPAIWPESTGGGATRSELQKARDDLQRQLSAMRSHARVEATGWMPMPARIWMWYEIRVPAGDPSIPGSLVPDYETRFEGARWWRFIRNAGTRPHPSSKELTVDCLIMRLRGGSNAEADEQLRQAGPQFLAMLRRMSIEPR